MKIKKERIPKGEGKIISSDGAHPFALYHGEDGTFFAFSADCPHAHCDVMWNKRDATWDCPCHASRFSKEGTVLSGPADESLKKLSLKDEGDELDIAYDGEEVHA